MRSRHADRFNHDEDAPGYDADVLREEHPIRAGYAAALDWVVERAAVTGSDEVLDLGTGTGNLIARLPDFASLTAVDVSEAMLELAAGKFGGDDRVNWVQDDLLGFFDCPGPAYDAVISTYALHHLTYDEKQALFEAIGTRLAPGARVLFADLMFESPAERARILDAYRAAGDGDLVSLIEDEFFWDVEPAAAAWRELGFTVETHRLSTLSWGLAARSRV